MYHPYKFAASKAEAGKCLRIAATQNTRFHVKIYGLFGGSWGLASDIELGDVELSLALLFQDLQPRFQPFDPACQQRDQRWRFIGPRRAGHLGIPQVPVESVEQQQRILPPCG